MSDWVVGAFALGGALAGGALGFAGAIKTEAMRGQRERFFQEQRRGDERADRLSEHELTAIAETRAILDEMAKGTTSFNTAIIQVAEDDRSGGFETLVHVPKPLRLSSMAEMNGLRARLMSRTAMLHGQDLRDALDFYATAAMTLVGSTDFEGAIAAGKVVTEGSLAAALRLAAREQELLAVDMTNARPVPPRSGWRGLPRKSP